MRLGEPSVGDLVVLHCRPFHYCVRREDDLVGFVEVGGG